MSNQDNSQAKNKKINVVLAILLVAAVVFAAMTYGQKNDLDKQITDLTAQIETLKKDLETVKGEAEAAEIAKAEAELAALRAKGPLPDWKPYDELINQIKTTTDFAGRVKLMHEAEDMLMDTGAIVPVYYYNDLFMVKPDVEGFYTNNYGNKFFLYATKGDADTLRINLASEPDKLDPALNSSVDGACLAINSFGGLYTYNAEGVLEPNFATGYTVSEDGLTYEFTMREGLKWSNGDALNAKDFEYSWKRAAAPETAADYSYMFNGIAGYYTYVENAEGKGAYDLVDDAYVPQEVAEGAAPTGKYDLVPALQVTASEDGTKLTVALDAPCAYFLDLTAFPTFFAVHQPTVEAAAGYKDDAGNVVNPGAWATEAGFVTSGAFTLESWVHNESMVYVRNPNFWDAENVKLEKLEFMLSADETAIYAAYKAGDLDFIDAVPQDEIKGLIGTPEFNVINQLGTYYVCFNVKSKLFEGKTVEEAANMRKAFSALIDRQYIVDAIGQTGQQPATSFIPGGMLDGNNGIFKDAAGWSYPVGDGYYPVERDVGKAVELLKSAGFQFDDQNKLTAETPLSFEYVTNQSAGHVAIAETIQQDLAEVGITMTIKTLEWNVFLNERKNGNYDVARNGWIADFNDPINMLEMWSTASGNNDVQFGK
ncbi:MAG: ABC transporter substrate-binding protein [Christensenellales bacterium]